MSSSQTDYKNYIFRDSTHQTWISPDSFPGERPAVIQVPKRTSAVGTRFGAPGAEGQCGGGDGEPEPGWSYFEFFPSNRLWQLVNVDEEWWLICLENFRDLEYYAF